MSSTKHIPVGHLLARWRKDPAYAREFAELEGEFAIAAALISARSHAGLTQAELARRMGTTQSAVARMEGGKVKPSTATLEKVAAATGMRLKVVFEPKASAA